MTSIVRSRQDRRVALQGVVFFPVVAVLAGLFGACTPAQVVGGTGGDVGGARGGNAAGNIGANGGAGGSVTFTLPPTIDGGPDLPGGGHCGNGKLEGVEQCDDGNTASGDGCSQSCQIEANYDCPKAGEPCINLAVCGNGVLTSDEICDDGNTLPGDGCAANCQSIDTGWICPVPGKKCIPKCGDGVITGSEACDDGNTASGDGCSSTCQLEPGFDCKTSGPGKACIKSDCGNGKLEAGEQCDCGRTDKEKPDTCKAINGLFYGDGKGCSKTCTQEPSCLDSAGKTQACAPKCGDGNIDIATEECDDGNLADGDGCSSKCKKEAGFTCTSTKSADSSKCQSGTGNCLQMPIVYRDFQPENVTTGGHPDFYFLGTKAGGATAPTTICVPNSGGPSKGNDSTARCWDITAAELLNGKPQYNAARASNTCACQFSEWSPGNTSRIPGGYTKADSPLAAGYLAAGTALNAGKSTGQITGYTSTGGPIWKGTVPIVKDADSFKQWFNDDKTVNSTFTSVLEMAETGSGTNTYQFASKNHLAGKDNGFFPLTDLNPTQATMCDLWPYWNRADGTPIWTTCQGDQYLFPPRVTDTDCGGNAAGGCWISNTPGVKNDSYFTTEARYFFAYDDKTGLSLQFFGDDDLFIFINGKLVLDLGGVHQQLPGKVTVAGNPGVASIIEGGCLDATGVITGYTAGSKACSPTNGNPPTAVSGDDFRVRSVDLGLKPGSIYEIAIFGADRHPPESNYQLTLSGFTTTKSSCLPRCGDGVATAGEQCDCGDGTVPVPASCTGANDDAVYGGCKKDCTYGPFCGDGVPNGKEECDLGKQNGDTSLGKDGCTIGCLKPHFCGDKNVDPGEECDLGVNNGLKLDLTTRQPSDAADAQVFCNKDCTIPPGIVF